MSVLVIRVNGKILEDRKQAPFEIVESLESRIEKMVDKFFSKIALPASIGLGILTQVGITYAEQITNTVGLGDRLMPLLHMLQDFGLPAGIIMSTWGLIEMMLGNIESGKHKMKWAIIGFVGMFIIPDVFFAIRDGFRH